MNNRCPNCGGMIYGDGYNIVMHCEYASPDDYDYKEPDADPVMCRDTVEIEI